MEKANILIVGAGPAGLAAAKAVVKQGESVVLCGDEPYNPYWRTRLPSVIAEETDIDKLSIVKDDWFQNNNVMLIKEKTMVELDTDNNCVIWSDGSKTKYKKLILATGASCFIPKLNTTEEIFALRDFNDANIIRKKAIEKKKAVVIGGGLLGLEIACEIKKLNIPVTIVELDKYLMARQLDKLGGEYLERKLSDTNFSILTGTNANDVPDILKGSCVVVAAGIRSNVDAIKGSKLKMNRAIVVDKQMRTSVNNVFACGDVAEFNGNCYGLISIANMQGTVAGNNATGIASAYQDILPMSMLKNDRISVMSIGDLSEENEKIFYRHNDENKYQAFAVKDNKIVGAGFIGDTSLGFKTKSLIEKKTELKNVSSIEDIIEQL